MSSLVKIDNLLETAVYTPMSKIPLALESALFILTEILPKNKIRFEIEFYLKLNNALRIIALFCLEKNGLREYMNSKDWVNLSDISDYDQRILNCFADLSHRLGIFEKHNDFYRISPKYTELLSIDCAYLIQRVLADNCQLIKQRIDRHEYCKELIDFIDIYLLICFRNGNTVSHNVLNMFKLDTRWKYLIESQAYDIQLEMAEYTFELLNISLKTKTKSTREQSFYTKLGQQALEQLIKENFIELIENLKQQYQINTILDVGCGYGNHLEIFAQMGGFRDIYGIEYQTEVCKKLEQKFHNYPEVKIFNGNIFDLVISEKVDLIFLNYVLFYFSKVDKLRLFNQLNKLLSKNGVIVLCQYYSKIESIQKNIARFHQDLSIKKQIELYFSNNVLYSEVLLNESLDVFQASEQWDEFLQLLNQTNMEVRYLTNADNFYYSLFIVIEKVASIPNNTYIKPRHNIKDRYESNLLNANFPQSSSKLISQRIFALLTLFIITIGGFSLYQMWTSKPSNQPLERVK
jgi:SAM-dependent methyltransferase